jgi:hypothetical protein
MTSIHSITEAGRLYRRLPAARRRADLAKARAGRTGKPEHLDAATELEAGYVRMEARYFEALAQVL